MKYEWIDTGLLPEDISCKKIYLFGAGKGTEQFLEHHSKSGRIPHIQAIVDNNCSLHGSEIQGIKIRGTEILQPEEASFIIVTSVSGKEKISKQLLELGFNYKDFCCIGIFPSTYRETFEQLITYIPLADLRGKRILHIGSGGFLGLELLLFAVGASYVVSIDRYEFGICYPDVTKKSDLYLDAINYIDSYDSISNEEKKVCLGRANLALIQENGKMLINKSLISYVQPADIEALPFKDQSFDLVVSNALMEHLISPKIAVEEVYRVTKKGGANYHKIITRDHRAYSPTGKFHAFSFRQMSEMEWDKTIGKSFYQNRLLPVQWNALFQNCGFSIESNQIDEQLDVNDYGSDMFHKNFSNFSMRELGEVDCTLFVRK